jgi:HSP20 family protein
MATRNETTEVKQQGQQNAQQNTATRSGTEVAGGARTERERGLKTSRESGPHTGMVRSDRPAWGLTDLSPGRSPFSLMRRMMEDMDRVFEDFGLGRGFGIGRGLSPLWGGAGQGLWSDVTDGGGTLWSPAIEVFEKGNNLVVRAELPGLSKDDVNVNITNDAITIEGERRQESEDRGEGFYRSERSYGRFFRSIPLPEGADADKADATFKDGVLEVTLPTPKREQQRGRKIQVR